MEHCETCEAWAEHRRCPDCGMTGEEIQEARVRDFIRELDDATEETHP